MRYKGVEYVPTANFELDTMIACEEFTPSPQEQKYMKVYGKHGYIKKDFNNFYHLCKQYGLYDGRRFRTKYGWYTISRPDASALMLTIYGRFDRVDGLPKSKNIGGYDVNPYSGKWNFHFSHCYGWHPAGALCSFLTALKSILVEV